MIIETNEVGIAAGRENKLRIYHYIIFETSIERFEIEIYERPLSELYIDGDMYGARWYSSKTIVRYDIKNKE